MKEYVPNQNLFLIAKRKSLSYDEGGLYLSKKLKEFECTV